MLPGTTFKIASVTKVGGRGTATKAAGLPDDMVEVQKAILSVLTKNLGAARGVHRRHGAHREAVDRDALKRNTNSGRSQAARSRRTEVTMDERTLKPENAGTTRDVKQQKPVVRRAPIAVGAANDSAEREADAVADSVVANLGMGSPVAEVGDTEDRNRARRPRRSGRCGGSSTTSRSRTCRRSP